MRIRKMDETTRKNIISELLKRDPNQYTQYADTVQKIVEDVHQNGDAAVLAYTEKFDHAALTADQLRVTEE